MTLPLQTDRDSMLLDNFTANFRREKEDCVLLPDGKTRLRGDGSGMDIRHDGVLVSPNVGFVLKTKVHREKEKKIFINICYHDEIEPPGHKKKLDKDGNTIEGLNVPLSMSPVRICKDKANMSCLVVDAIVHPSVKDDIEKDQTGAHRDMLCTIIMQCFDQKYPELAPLDLKYKLPRLVYFGYVDSKTGDVFRKQGENTEVYKQNVRARKTQPKIEDITNPILQIDRKKKALKAKRCNEIQRNISNRTTLPTLDFEVKLKMLSGEEMNLARFIEVAREQLHAEGRESSTLIAPIHRNEGLPLLLDRKVCETLTVKSIEVNTKLPSFDESTQVEVSAFVVNVTGNGFQNSKLVLPLCVDPEKTTSKYHEESFILSVNSIVASASMEENLDVGSQPWILAYALASTETKVNESTNEKDEGKSSSESTSSCEKDPRRCDGFDDVYHTRPIYLRTDNFSSDGQSKTKESIEADVELPEDRFHAKDTISQHWLHEQEKEQKEKQEKRCKERQERQADESVEYVDAKDFKPGGKYYVRKTENGSRLNESNLNGKVDDNANFVLMKAEELIRKKYKSSLKNDLWSKLF